MPLAAKVTPTAPSSPAADQAAAAVLKAAVKEAGKILVDEATRDLRLQAAAAADQAAAAAADNARLAAQLKAVQDDHARACKQMAVRDEQLLLAARELATARSQVRHLQQVLFEMVDDTEWAAENLPAA
jgi:hypothetical protein